MQGVKAVRVAAWLTLAALAPVACAQPAGPLLPLSASLIDTTPIPTHSTLDQHGTAITIAGLSGIVALPPASAITPPADAGARDYLAIMDNSNVAVRLRVRVAPDGGEISEVTVHGAIRFDQVRDWEAVALSSRPGRVVLAEEGTPSLAELDPGTGRIAWTADAPAPFRSRRANKGFESLTIDARGESAWTANEEALTVDGPASSTSAPTVVRLLNWRLGMGRPTPRQQHAYLVDRIPGAPISGGGSGLSELVLLEDGRLLALERSLSLTPGLFRSRLYEVGLTAATDVRTRPALAGTTYTPATKRLLWEGSVQNLEGLCVGPRLPDGRVVLIGVVDDGDPISVNTVVALALSGVGPPRATASNTASN
jgi:hypothetical protein